MKNKLSPLDEIRLERKRLKNECAQYEQNLADNLDYAKGNLGRLAIGSVVSYIQNGIANLLVSFAGGNKEKQGAKDNENGEQQSSSMMSQMAVGAIPFLWEMIQPMIIGIITKKATSFFSGQKKKKKVVKKAKASDLE